MDGSDSEPGSRVEPGSSVDSSSSVQWGLAGGLRSVLRYASVGLAALSLTIGPFPTLSAWGAEAIASGLGCKLDEAHLHPCYVLGQNIDELLYNLFTLGWLSLVTLPLAGIGLALSGGLALGLWLWNLLEDGGGPPGSG